MSYLADTHMHSIYSYDGQMCIEDMINRGEKLGLKYMAFSEHLEFGQISIKQFLNRYKVYTKEIERLQAKHPNIRLLKAVEFTNPEKYPKELEIVNSLDLDYIIGSNHELPKDASQKEMLGYYRKILMIVKQGGIDCLGHMDYLRRKFNDSNISEEIISNIFREMIKNNITLEINSSARRRKDLDSFPSHEKLQIYINNGGEKVTIGSDAHRLEEIYDSVPDIDSEYDLNKGVYIKRKFTSLNSK